MYDIAQEYASRWGIVKFYAGISIFRPLEVKEAFYMKARWKENEPKEDQFWSNGDMTLTLTNIEIQL